MNSLQDQFKKTGLKELQKELGIKNPMAVPTLSKIAINVGVKDAILDEKNVEKASSIFAQITGQKPKVTKAKKAISGFKLREGMEIGLMTTLRGKKMYDFFEKLVTIVLPRLRDFHGVSKESFDNRGNYSLGFEESAVFPEVDTGKIEKVQGFEITIVTTAKNKKEGFLLLQKLGMPFKKDGKVIKS